MMKAEWHVLSRALCTGKAKAHDLARGLAISSAQTRSGIYKCVEMWVIYVTFFSTHSSWRLQQASTLSHGFSPVVTQNTGRGEMCMFSNGFKSICTQPDRRPTRSPEGRGRRGIQMDLQEIAPSGIAHKNAHTKTLQSTFSPPLLDII